ncbi:MAG: single-stranded DNA binding protein [Halobacteriaceae archaeon]
MGAIEDVYEDLDADVDEAEFRAAVEEKVEQMGGLADEETAAMLVAHEVADREISGVADIDPGMEEVKFLAKVVTVGELRTFERDDDDDRGEGRVLNVDVADETGQVRITFWDEQAEGAADELDPGTVLRIAGRPRDGYSGVEVSVDRAEPEPDADIDVALDGPRSIEDLSLGMSGVTVRGRVLGVDDVREFDRDDGSTGRVSNLLLGDDTDRIRVTLWDDVADLVTEVDPGDGVEVVDGYVRERDGALELHCNDRSAIDDVEDTVDYEPDATPIDSVEIGDTVDIAGVIRSADPVRTFDRDDGSEGTVRNVTVQDETDTIRVALWGAKAEADLGPGDEVLFADVDIQDGWQDDLEASAGWQSTVVPLADGETAATDGEDEEDATGLDAFADGEGPTTDRDTDTTADADEPVEFTGVVVQAGDPIILDDGQRTVTVEADLHVQRGETVSLEGTIEAGRLRLDGNG